MSHEPPRILFVHAHPDDECLQTGGAMARYSTEGARVCLVTCTNGELGEIAPETGVRPEQLADVRLQELRESCAHLGVDDVRPLGYRDSGMEGTPANADPASFVNQPLDAVAERIADIVTELRPQVLVTYDEKGFYGHPDHITAHRAALRAVEMAPGPRVYYGVIPMSVLLAFAAEMESQGGMTVEEANRLGTDDALVTHQLDVAAFVDAKVKALEAHRTQRGTTGWLLDMPDDARALVLGTEWYRERDQRRSAFGYAEDLFR